MANRKNPVRSEMPKQSLNMTGTAGEYGHNKPPFSKGQDMGGGGIPTIFYQNIGGKAAERVPGPTQTAGVFGRKARAGTLQRHFGVTDE